MIVRPQIGLMGILGILAALGITAATEGLTNRGFAQQPLKFVMNLSGSEEVPPVQTEATGVAEITPGVDSITYNINLQTQKM